MRRASLILTLTAWLLATGSHWDLVQTFAWARMFTGYAQTMTFSRALQKTFAPQSMCSLCHAVSAAKQDEAGTPAVPAKSPGKILLVCAPRAVLALSPAPHCAGLIPASLAPASAERPAPPTPPPRALA